MSAWFQFKVLSKDKYGNKLTKIIVNRLMANAAVEKKIVVVTKESFFVNVVFNDVVFDISWDMKMFSEKRPDLFVSCYFNRCDLSRLFSFKYRLLDPRCKIRD
jgi:hypothetical protein